MTPTREQLAVELLKRIYDWNMLDSAADGSSWRREIAQVVAPIQPPTEGDLKWAAAACLAAPPPEPQAMPPIEVGDVVALVNGNAEAVLTQSHADYWNDRRPELLRAERITAIYRTSLWTREPRR